jgi:hypothetical protein
MGAVRRVDPDSPRRAQSVIDPNIHSSWAATPAPRPLLAPIASAAMAPPSLTAPALLGANSAAPPPRPLGSAGGGLVATEIQVTVDKVLHVAPVLVSATEPTLYAVLQLHPPDQMGTLGARDLPLAVLTHGALLQRCTTHRCARR